jgi:hypothetical protein
MVLAWMIRPREVLATVAKGSIFEYLFNRVIFRVLFFQHAHLKSEQQSHSGFAFQFLSSLFALGDNSTMVSKLTQPFDVLGTAPHDEQHVTLRL